MKKPTLEAAVQQTLKTTGYDCTYVEAVAKMSPAERAELARLLTDGKYPAEAISRALRGRGVQISGDILRRHRNGECASCRNRQRLPR